MVLNDTATKLGLFQDCEMKLFGDQGYGKITGDANRLLQFTARINRAQDRFVQLAMTADGRWQYDDTNDTDYPVFTTDIVATQRDYPFDVAMIVIDKVAIRNSANGVWGIIPSLDIQDPSAFSYIENNTNNVGIPIRYDKNANSIILDPVPNYSTSVASGGAGGGIRVYAHRGANYFASTDTTKSPGFAVAFHSYLSLYASWTYAKDRTMTTKAAELGKDVIIAEDAILEFFSKRNRDEQKTLKPVYRSSR